MMRPRLPRPLTGLRRAAAAALLALALLAAPRGAAAQDSFVRIADAATGQPVLSALGTGLGEPYSSLRLDLACPARFVWPLDVTGGAFPLGAPVRFGLGERRGDWYEVHLRAAELEPDGRLRLDLDRASFRSALAQARSGEPVSPRAEAILLIGEAQGLVVNLDALVEEMTDFARACGPAPDDPRRRPGPVAAYAR